MKKEFSFNDIFTRAIDFYQDYTLDFSSHIFKGSLFYLILMMLASSYVLITWMLTSFFNIPNHLTIALDPLLVEELSKMQELKLSVVSVSSIQIPFISVVYWTLQILTFLLMPFAFLMLFFSLSVLLKRIADSFEKNAVSLLETKQNVRQKSAVLFGGLLLHVIISFGGFLFLFIPGIFFLIRFSFVYFVILFEQKGLVDAFKRSWALTEGVFWKLFLFKIIFILLWFIFMMPFYMGMTFIDIPIALRYLVYVSIFALTIPVVLIFYYFLFLELKQQTDGSIRIQIHN